MFEKEDDVTKLISKCETSTSESKLEDYLDQVELTVNNYKQICKNYSHNSLYLEISAYKDNKVTTYNVPLNINDNCDK